MVDLGKRISVRFTYWKLILCSSCAWGLLAHGMCFFNKYSTGDDVGRFNLAATYISGRWMLGVMKRVYHILVAPYIFSTPLFNGLFSILCISVIVVLMVDMLSINNRLCIIAICGIMVAFPVVTGMFGYMFTAPFYLLGLLFGVFGVWIFQYRISWYIFLTSTLLIACSIGTYQANLAFCASLLLMTLIKWVYFENIDNSIKETLKRCMFSLALCGSFLLTYFFLNNTVLKITNTELLSYSDINSFGITTLHEYIKRVALTYSEFFSPCLSSELYPIAINRYYKIILALAIFFSALMFFRCMRKNVLNSLVLCILFLVMPVSLLLVMVMTNMSNLHSLMYYSVSLLFVFIVWLAEKLEFKQLLFKSAFKLIVPGFVLFISVIYCKYDNICYMEADCFQEQTKAYCTSLVTRIKSIDGYDDSMPVTFVGLYRLNDKTIANIPQFDVVSTNPYGRYSVNRFSRDTLKRMVYWCGFDPEMLDAVSFYNLPEVQEMPCYPDDKSVAVIDGTVVVKLSDDYYDDSFWENIENITKNGVSPLY